MKKKTKKKDLIDPLEEIRLREELEEESSRWTLPYGNLMTVCMIFFFILYALTFWTNKVDYERIVTKIQTSLSKFDLKHLKKLEDEVTEVTAAKEMQDRIVEEGIDKYAKIDITAHKIKISLTSPILFDLGSAELKEEAKAVLDSICPLLESLPNNEVIIEGHTCNLPVSGGKYKSNWGLSLARAIAVIDYFTKVKNFNPARFSAAGYGEYKPLYPNDCEENRAKNRRIEIVILRK
jgi:chemotaxis protein MotB